MNKPKCAKCKKILPETGWVVDEGKIVHFRCHILRKEFPVGSFIEVGVVS